MFAEVITGRFNGEGKSAAAAYSLPVSAHIGLPVLDRAHEALLARLNAAHRALSAGDEANARLQLDMMGSDLATHFDIEEGVMQALGFAGMRDHIRHHATSMAQFNEICRTSLSRGSLTVGDLDLCYQGLVDEILRGDLDLKSHFQSMGSTRPAQGRGA
ncbi:MAG TPA: hemerythrin domain-containing protein [Dongiaceae bacterium]|nr:hemerythrin domain-containing protein [Dongiaceae bacterium]